MTASSAMNMIKELRSIFGERLQENVHMSNYTTAQVGGPADALLVAQSGDELEDFVRKVWALDLPLYILGSGSNMLVSDQGIHGVVIINRAHTIKVNAHVDPPGCGPNPAPFSAPLPARWRCVVFPAWNGLPPSPVRSAERFTGTPEHKVATQNRPLSWPKSCTVSRTRCL